jgi:hypothetical protein
MTSPANRRGFLRGLTTLPLIGGGVSLIGNPTAAAEPVTSDLLDAYNQWLFYERRLLCLEAHGSIDAERMVPQTMAASLFHFPLFPHRWQELPQPSSRAALVLSAVGCSWREEA